MNRIKTLEVLVMYHVDQPSNSQIITAKTPGYLNLEKSRMNSPRHQTPRISAMLFSLFSVVVFQNRQQSIPLLVDFMLTSSKRLDIKDSRPGPGKNGSLERVGCLA
jgi:hypothetical protein